MNTDNVLMPRVGDILHCERNTISSKTIGFFTKGKSHTAIVIEIWGELYVIEAQGKGVNPIRLDFWCEKWKYNYVISRRIILQNPREYSSRAMSRSGRTKYDWFGTLVCQPIYILTGKWLSRKNETKDGRMYCSDFVGWMEKIPEYWKKSPEAIYQYCLKNTETYLTF